MLKQFHEKYGHHIFDTYKVPTEVINLRMGLIDEEVNDELLASLNELAVTKDYFKSMVEISDAVADSLYVIFGTCVSLGIPIDEIFAEVHRSNMSKSDKKNSIGKTMKGDNYKPPQIEKILEKHGFKR